MCNKQSQWQQVKETPQLLQLHEVLEGRMWWGQQQICIKQALVWLTINVLGVPIYGAYQNAKISQFSDQASHCKPGLRRKSLLPS